MYGVKIKMNNLFAKAAGRLMKDNRGTFVEFIVTGKKEPDEYGNDGTVYLKQTKEEREAKADKIYFGANAKWIGFEGSQRPENCLYEVKLYLDELKGHTVLGNKTGIVYASVNIAETKEGKPYVQISQTKEQKAANAEKVYPGFVEKRQFATAVKDTADIMGMFGIDAVMAQTTQAIEGSASTVLNGLLQPEDVDDLPF